MAVSNLSFDDYEEEESPVVEEPYQDGSYTPEDPRLLEALFSVESNNNPNALGPVTKSGEQAMGLGQIMPGTWKEFAKEGMDPFNPHHNTEVSNSVLSRYYNKYKDIKLALAAYNAGPGTIDGYLDRTQSKTYDEVAGLMEQDNSYSEARKYVPKVLGKYDQIKGNPPSAFGSNNPDMPDDSQGIGTPEQFANVTMREISTPSFQTLSTPDKVQRISELYNQRKWAPEVDELVKDIATDLWSGAEPEEEPQFKEPDVIGAPPQVESGMDVEKATQDWKIQTLDRLDKQGINTDLFGRQLDTYLDDVIQKEKDAYTARNRGIVGWGLNRAGNYVRQGAKGVLGTGTQPTAGALRLGGQSAAADVVQSAPDMWLGTPANDFLYKTDENGYPVENPDGTFQKHWQSEAAEAVGMVVGTIGTLGVGSFLGASSKLLATGNITANTLGMANNSFKTVYDETGSTRKAYMASFFTLPAAFIGSIGEWGIVAGMFRPTLRSLSGYDQARYIGESLTRNVAIGAVSGGGADIVQQLGETGQTGEDISLERTAVAAGTSALGAGIAGTAFDTLSGRQAYNVNEARKTTQINRAAEELTRFRDSVDLERPIEVDAQYVPKDLAETLGVAAVSRGDGTTLLTKKTSQIVNEAADIVDLVRSLETQPTPSEVVALAKVSPEDAVKFSNAEHVNNIKATERAIALKLQEDPSALPVRYDPNSNKWENVETGKSETFLKDLIFAKDDSDVVYGEDLSDISHVNIIDEELLTPETTSKRTQNKINKIREKGLGALITKGDRSEIVLPSGLSPEAKSEVLAHELAHAVGGKVKLSPEANFAVDAALANLTVRGLDENASDIAKQFFLPEISNIVKVPEGVSVSGLTKASKNALTSKKEFLANQIGAIILKRSGKSIGDYSIVPELEAVLENTKLPSIGEESGRLTPEGTKEASNETSQSPTEESASLSGISERTRGETRQSSTAVREGSSLNAGRELSTGPNIPATIIDARTGEQGETAFSRTVREVVPERPATLYPKISRIKGISEATQYLNKNGATKIKELLATPESLNVDPLSRVFLTDALLNKASADLEANPTPANKNAYYEADQMRGAVGTGPAQQMAAIQRIRGTKSFGDFLVQVRKEYEGAGLPEPEYTDFQLKELKALYKQAMDLPPGRLQDNYVQKLFEATGGEAFSWSKFIPSALRTNLLGIGTSLINTSGGFFMGPLTLALSHPTLGRGLIWKAIFGKNTRQIARANFKSIWEGKPANTLLEGLIDPTPFSADPLKGISTEGVLDKVRTIPRFMAAYYNKFGKVSGRILKGTDAYWGTLSAEGYGVYRKYRDLQEKYAGNPEKFTAEVSKLLLSSDDIKAQMLQAEREGKAVGLNLTDADKGVRAYEIIRERDFGKELMEEMVDFANSTSLRGDVMNPVPLLFNRLLTAYEGAPLIGPTSHVVVPFARPMIKLSDYAMDWIPGNALIDRMTERWTKGTRAERGPRSRALRERLINGQKVGTGLAILMMGLSRSGLLNITGEEEIALDRGGEGDSLGKRAKTRAQFKESEQKAIPPYSILLPNGKGIVYKDIPGLNAIMYGIYRANKAIDSGMGYGMAGVEFFRNAFTSAVPIFGGMTSLNSPYTKLLDEAFEPEFKEERVLRTLEQIGGSVAKMITPGSAVLRELKNMYDSTPEETNQSVAISMVKDIPGAAELFGSKPVLDRFGEPVERTILERIPGAKRIIASSKLPGDEVALKAFHKGLIIPELNRTVKFNKSDFPSEAFQRKYETTYEERTGKAYTGSLTPDEWYAFIIATGPQVKRVVNSIASSNLPLAVAQKMLLKRVRAIEDQSKKRYIRTGEF